MSGAPSSPGWSAVMRHHANAIEAATATNIRHITFTGIVDTDELSPFCFSPVENGACWWRSP
jgi:NAD(P)H dehydrogenase (quinone)